MKNIKIIVGSLRRGSFARKTALNVINILPSAYAAEIIEIGHLPLYNLDYDDPNEPQVLLPDSYTEFREAVKSADGILFVTPENNRTIPACLKNAVDIGSKPNNDVAWTGKATGIISHSVGKMGGYSAHKNLRLALSYFDMPTTGQPEVFLGNSHELFDEHGVLTVDSTRDFLKKYLDTFLALVEKHS